MVAQSFTTRNPLDVAARVPCAAHTRLLSSLWPRLVHDDLSFVVKDPQRGILGVVINTDFFNEPQVGKLILSKQNVVSQKRECRIHM